ncbi:ABC transporter ATP-binding protein [Paenibacillus sp. MBLB4367]|uniref:ABC transporter ATP-binding protein n=1 Tax=Paenibacillus sp. MBLB4367 TaxID=3384767 RepID=UPI003908181B
MANIKWLWSHVKQAKGLLLAATLLMALEALSNLASVGLVQKMTDDVLLGGQSGRFWPLLAQIAAAYLAYSLLFTFGPHTIHLTNSKIRTSMCGELMRHMHRIPIGTLQKERTANYVYLFTNDLQTCAGLGGSDIPRLMQQVAAAIAIMVIMGSASPVMLGVMCVFVSLYVILGKTFAPARKQASGEVNRHKSDLLVHLEEGVSSTREVIAFHRQDWETNVYRNKFQTYFASVMKEGKLINKQMMLSDPLKWGAVLFVLAYGGMLVLDGKLSIGMFVVTYQFTSRMMESLNGIYQFAMGLSGKMASVERVRVVLEDERIPNGAELLREPIRSIRFEEVSFRYGDQPVLERLQLTIEEGQKTAFVGSSGGGKSTIASLLVRFFEPASGRILINDAPLPDIHRSAWMDRVTIVFQEPYLFPDTIRTNLLLGCENVSEARIAEVCRAMLIHDFIASLPDGYDTVIGERGITLSGGQRQRLALARAVLRDTEVLILDEATSSLDMETERQVQENLDRLRKGRITVIIAHRLSTIRNADLIMVMDRGSVAEQGTHDQLLAYDSVYRRLVQKQTAASLPSAGG